MTKLSNMNVRINTRHYGIDALRIVSMLMVLICHVLYFGGVLDGTDLLAPKYISAWTLYTLCDCSVNCFGLISGYVGINSKYKYTNLVLLWLQVVIYSFGGTLLFYLMRGCSGGGLQLLFAMFPVTSKQFWYFSAYVGVYLFMPILNRMVHMLSRKEAKVLCVLIVIAFSALHLFGARDSYMLMGGYSFAWLLLLYILGACLRKFDFFADVKTYVMLLVFAGSVVLSVGLMLILDADVLPFLASILPRNALLNYNSPNILVCGMSLLIVFSRMKNMPACLSRAISLLSPVSFGVYIIHVQTDIFELIFGLEVFRKFAGFPVVLMICAVLLSAVVLYLLCGIVDKIRIVLFDKLKIKQRLLQLEKKYIGDVWVS